MLTQKLKYLLEIRWIFCGILAFIRTTPSCLLAHERVSGHHACAGFFTHCWLPSCPHNHTYFISFIHTRHMPITTSYSFQSAPFLEFVDLWEGGSEDSTELIIYCIFDGR